MDTIHDRADTLINHLTAEYKRRGVVVGAEINAQMLASALLLEATPTDADMRRAVVECLVEHEADIFNRLDELEAERRASDEMAALDRLADAMKQAAPRANELQERAWASASAPLSSMTTKPTQAARPCSHHGTERAGGRATFTTFPPAAPLPSSFSVNRAKGSGGPGSPSLLDTPAKGRIQIRRGLSPQSLLLFS